MSLTHRAHSRCLEGCGDFRFLQKEALPSQGQGGVPDPGALRRSGESLMFYSSGRLTICGCLYLSFSCFVSLKHHCSDGMPMFIGSQLRFEIYRFLLSLGDSEAPPFPPSCSPTSFHVFPYIVSNLHIVFLSDFMYQYKI